VATDGHRLARVEITAPEGAAGMPGIIVPRKTVIELRKLVEEGEEEVQIALGERNEMVLRSGRSTFTLACLPPEDYPVMSAGELPHHFALSAAELRSLIDRTRFAISTEETRYYLNGIYLHATKNNEVPVIRAVATDGHRLARVEITAPEGAAGMPGIIVPRKTVIELRKLVEEGEEEVQIALGETKIRCAIGEAALTSKLIDGTFPDYDRVIPANNDKILEVECKEFAEAVDRVSTISTERSRAVKLAIEQGNLVVSATSPENGTALEELEVRYQSSPMEIGFNSRYLLDITEQIDGEYAQFKMSDAGSPTIVCDREDASALFVLMPMRV
jgi:DNA polymerase-3 subunit beta